MTIETNQTGSSVLDAGEILYSLQAAAFLAAIPLGELTIAVADSNLPAVDVVGKSFILGTALGRYMRTLLEREFLIGLEHSVEEARDIVGSAPLTRRLM